METFEALEDKIKLAISKQAKLESENVELLEEVKRLRQFVYVLEDEKKEVKKRLDDIIDKIELYLSREG